ncbi:MAG: heavy metal-responsive transcriptional regulator [Planctomycetes bacterium]|jgi:DNA-binding transcriptional MerR regulator|nr:heavy metal-responsive transcriptional regulator [Planctomycetota bacterium]MDP7246746.1 MerR family transcriptional regulator [Planctomycetota bacterium]
MASQPQPLDIAQLAKEAGVSSRTIRYYGELGLVRPDGRGPGGRRLFGADALERLRFISRLKSLGMSLEEIGDLNSAFDRGKTPALLFELEPMLKQRLDELQIRMAELKELKEDLSHYLVRIQEKQNILEPDSQS